MRAGFPQGKPGKQDAKRIATRPAHQLLRCGKRLTEKTESGISSDMYPFYWTKVKRGHIKKYESSLWNIDVVLV